MAALVIYDSAYGNTAAIAEALAEAIGGGARAQRFSDLNPTTLPDADLLIVGSPTQGGRPTQSLLNWLLRVPTGALAGRRIAAFDTRLPSADQNFALRTLMGLIGYAAPRIQKSLIAKGGQPVTDPEGFTVEGREGPLRDGELKRAARWATGLLHPRA